jgi:hypothetical protein
LRKAALAAAERELRAMDFGSPQGNTLLGKLLQWCLKAPDLDLTRRLSLYSLVGLPLLYASAYFLPPLGSTGAYFLPSDNLCSLIIVPSVAFVAVGAVAIYLISAAARAWCTPRVATVGAVLALSLLTLIALKGIVYAAGYDWQERIPRGQEILSSLRYFKFAVSFIVLVLVWTTRRALPKLNRLLSSFGFAFGVLAVMRLFVLWNGTQALLALPATASAAQSVQASSVAARAAPPPADARPRRVVWVLFDETDFNRVYAAEAGERLELPNFDRLARTSVFATNANSPASATLYSVPALLAGVPISGTGVQIRGGESLLLERANAKPIPFGEATSIFGAITASGRGASVLGFFHPYCKLFKLQRCDSFPFPEIGGLDGALWANIPDSISMKLRHKDYWADITQRSLLRLPQYLARDDALTFIHLNFPHLPADYADQLLHLPPSSSPLTEYSRNLLFTDRILGRIVQELQQQASRHELLLVVSSDHWLRNRWYRASEPETSRPIPLIVWRVGESTGYVLSQPVSTVHTAAMILDYLNGNLSTQEDIARWWANQPVYPSFIAPET